MQNLPLGIHAGKQVPWFEDLNSFVSNFTSEDHHVLPAIPVAPVSLFKTPARGWWSLPEQLCALELFRKRFKDGISEACDAMASQVQCLRERA